MSNSATSAAQSPLREYLARYGRQTLRTLQLVWASGPRFVVLNVALALAQNLPPIGVVYLTKHIVDTLTRSLTEPGTDADRLFANIVPLLLGVLGALLLVAGARAAAQHTGYIQTQQVTNHIFDAIHRKAAQLDLSYYDDPQYQNVIFLAKQALNSPQGLVNSLTQLVQNLIAIAAVWVALFVFNPWVTLLLVAAALPALLIKLTIAPRQYRWQKEHASDFRLVTYLSTLLTNTRVAKEIRLHNLGEHLTGRYQAARALLQAGKRQQSKVNTLVELGAQTSVAVAGIVTYGYVAYLAIQGTITIGDMVMYYQLFQRGQSVLQGITSNLTTLYENSIYASSVFDFIDLPPKVVAPPAHLAQPFPNPLRAGIRFEHVTFRYPNSTTPAFCNLNLTIRPGEVVALVGENGAGKSTLIKLLCRLYDPSEGRITVDGLDLREIDLESLQRNMGVIFQDFISYELTVKDNIWLGNVDAPPDQAALERAARRAEIHEKLHNLPDGYETELLGRWRKDARQLSGGEWQKLALARLFFRDSQILILDEPASALDAPSEYNLFLTLKEAMRGKTGLIISHRFSTIRMADSIYVLDKGEITEQGTHEELMRRDGLYARMFRLQAESYLRERV